MASIGKLAHLEIGLHCHQTAMMLRIDAVLNFSSPRSKKLSSLSYRLAADFFFLRGPNAIAPVLV
jgi:hypothetical protein